MGKVIVIANQKGGTGKTTTVLNLGAALTRFHERNVVLVDLDPQGSLTIHVGLHPDQLTYHVGRVLQQVNLYNRSLVGLLPDLTILPSHPSLDDLAQKEEKRTQLKKKFAVMLQKASGKSDFVIIDCPPTLGVIAFLAMCAADAMLIPLQCEFMALRGVQLLLKTIEKARTECNPRLEILGILPTMFDRRTLHSQEVLEEIKTALKNRVHVFSTIIYKSVRFPESTVSMSPIFDYAPEIPGAHAYQKLAEEVIQYGQKTG